MPAISDLNGNTVFSGTSLRSRLANGGGQEEILMESAPDQQTLLMPQWSSDARYLRSERQHRIFRHFAPLPPRQWRGPGRNFDGKCPGSADTINAAVVFRCPLSPI